MKPRPSPAVEGSEGRCVRRLLACAAACAFVASATTPARADSSTADALFRAGRKASAAHDDKTAAARFAESYRLDPAPGTALNWALSEEHLGQLASALEHAREALAGLGPRDPRRPISKQLVDRLETRTPRLTVRLAKGAPENTTVKRDDTELRGAALGVALPVDPGEHRVVVSAEGYEDTTTVVTAVEGKESAVEVHVGSPRPAPEKDKHPDEPPRGGPTPEAVNPPPVAEATKGSTSRAPAIALWAVGGGALVAGGVFGALVLKKKSIVDDHCQNKQCDADGLAAGTAGNRFSLASTISVGVGLVGVGLGTYWWLKAPAAAPAGTSFQLGPGHVGVRGSF
jgi:hypothetical protein